MSLTVTELIQKILDRAAEDSNASQDNRVWISWLNTVFTDYCRHAHALQGVFCVGGPVNTTGRYPLNDMYYRRVGNGGPLDGASDVGPLTVIGQSIYEISWDYWSGSSDRLHYLTELNEFDWAIDTNGEDPNETTTDEPVYFLIEDGRLEASPREQVQVLRIWPPELTAALGSSSTAGATLEVKGARLPLVMVETNPSATQTDVFELDDYSHAETVVEGVLAYHYNSFDQPAKAMQHYQLYLANREKERSRNTRRFRSARNVQRWVDTDLSARFG